MQHVSLKLGEVLWGNGEPIEYAYFPQGVVISLVATMEDGRSVEVTLVGEEGILGIRAVLGGKTSGNVALVQVPGGCLRIKAGVLQAEFKRGGVLQDRVLRYTRYLLAQVTQTAACNRVHVLEQRLARWLLMVHNRAKRDKFPITHDFLSQMLGTPRSEVTIAAGILRKAGVIQYERGKMTILNRKGLEAAACECYQVLAHEAYGPP